MCASVSGCLDPKEKENINRATQTKKKQRAEGQCVQYCIKEEKVQKMSLMPDREGEGYL